VTRYQSTLVSPDSRISLHDRCTDGPARIRVAHPRPRAPQARVHGCVPRLLPPVRCGRGASHSSRVRSPCAGVPEPDARRRPPWRGAPSD
jgi:hypothetical protein